MLETEAASGKPSDARRIVRTGQKGNPVRDAITIRPESKTHKSHLLCSNCEQRFNRLGESEVLRWLAPKARKQFPLHDRLRVGLPCGEIPPYSIYKGADVGLDTEKFTYFTLSVAWRRSIHEWMNFGGTPLPPWNLGTFGEQMRTFLVGDAEFPTDTAVMIIVCSDQYSRQLTWSLNRCCLQLPRVRIPGSRSLLSWAYGLSPAAECS